MATLGYTNFPGTLNPETNCRLHYVHVAVDFISLMCILIITVITVATVTRVYETVANTNELINDMNVLLPDARFGLQMLDLLCQNKNFTNYYPNVRGLCIGL